MNTIEELDIITRMRGEVMSHQDVTGENLFLAWGYPTAIGLFIEFLALQLWHEDWCSWLWMGIPLVGKSDHRYTSLLRQERHRSKDGSARRKLHDISQQVSTVSTNNRTDD